MRTTIHFVAAAALLSTGCLPHVMHSPRVEEDGLSGSVSLIAGRNREIGDLETRIVPSLYVGARHSSVPDDGDGPAASLGIQVPVLLAPAFFEEEDAGLSALLATSYVDLYAQPVRRSDPGFETGVGVLASTALVAPYLQLGRLDARGTGWYTTQLVAFTIGDDMGEGMLYMPTFVWRHRDAEGTSAANFSAGLGFGFGEDAATDHLITIGVTLEFGLTGN